MKSKHYPLLTAAIGAALVLIPGILILIIISSGDDSEVNAVIDQHVAQAESKAVESSRPEAAIATSSSNQQTISLSPSVAQVAMAKEDRTPLPEVTPTPVIATSVIPLASDESAFPGSSSNAIEEPASEMVPAPEEIEPADPLFASTESKDQPDDSSDLIEIPRRPVVSESYYDATGHMAMISQGQVADPVAGAPAAVDRKTGEPAEPKSETKEANGSDASGKSDTKRGSGRRRTKKDETEAGSSSDTKSSASQTMAPTGNPFLDGTGSMPKRATGQADVDPALIEDVVINTPAENAHVNRVEDLVATTAAKGWPIALVRSDLPDDVWWVQQVIGIQGNAFGARVNFGNEYTVRGSAYRMVIVFLDSPDEVRRFRIAKQFKEIPDGVRRSREFHYIRK